ncbi:transposase [Patescibacteria group bacterium]|nr:transposase [Patescibacteria group bacterium]MBU1028946.1 transposase [Patescibacteria group bacterium]MBU1915582.1 transposase [Patescibacteria group bacterium]
MGDDHVHLWIEIPSKHSVAYAVQVIKGKSSA